MDEYIEQLHFRSYTCSREHFYRVIETAKIRALEKKAKAQYRGKYPKLVFYCSFLASIVAEFLSKNMLWKLVKIADVKGILALPDFTYTNIGIGKKLMCLMIITITTEHSTMCIPFKREYNKRELRRIRELYGKYTGINHIIDRLDRGLSMPNFVHDKELRRFGFAQDDHGEFWNLNI